MSALWCYLGACMKDGVLEVDSKPGYICITVRESHMGIRYIDLISLFETTGLLARSSILFTAYWFIDISINARITGSYHGFRLSELSLKQAFCQW